MAAPIPREIHLDESLVRRFWSKVNRNGPVPAHRPELGRCWSWTGTRDRNGYGRLYLGGGRADPRQGFAHRISFAIANGASTYALNILHACDNPGCVRQKHLFSGTQADNIHDAMRKKRMRPHFTTLNAAKECCVNGHTFDEANTIWKRRENGVLRRQCRECNRAASRDYRRAQRAADRDGVNARKREWARKKREREAAA